MKFYITSLSLFVLTFLYLPFVLWALWRFWRNPRLRGVWKAVVMTMAVLLAYAIPLGDVTVNSLAMEKVCPSAGLHIYRAVEVDGYIGHSNLRDGPYRFIEFPVLRTNGTYYWIRYEKNPDGSISEKKLEKPTAVHEVLMADGYAQFNGFELPGYTSETHTTKSRWVIRNRITGEILAEWMFFRALPGWLDSMLVYRWFGTGGSALSCTTGSDFSIWPGKILLPKQSTN
jgi:hypothetical protein